jgi:hypothetical protein
VAAIVLPLNVAIVYVAAADKSWGGVSFGVCGRSGCEHVACDIVLRLHTFDPLGSSQVVRDRIRDRLDPTARGRNCCGLLNYLVNAHPRRMLSTARPIRPRI